VSQPSLSAQIQALEPMLGVQLIERKRGGIALTEMGKITERRAHDIVTARSISWTTLATRHRC
jgi:LysR family transcriptional regulator, hydrogen peroxide-inducible genes activator